MTLYARSDLVQVTIPRNQGGCGLPHTRPVDEGVPAKIWALDCQTCEDSIRAELTIKEQTHPHWSGTISGIPETPDEEAQREDEERRGQREAATVNRAALESLSTLPQVLQQMTAMFAAGQLPAIGQQLAAATVTCANGHPNLGNVKFCGECGTPIIIGGNAAITRISIPSAPVTTAPQLSADPGTSTFTRGSIAVVDPELDPSTKAPIDIADTSTVIETESLAGKPLAVLREIAKARGLPTKRSIKEQVAVLEGHAG